MKRFSYKEQYPRPEVQRISDGVIMRLEHVYEVDPALMGKHFNSRTCRDGTPSGSSRAGRPPGLDA